MPRDDFIFRSVNFGKTKYIEKGVLRELAKVRQIVQCRGLSPEPDK